MNNALLKAEMRRKGITAVGLCEQMGMSRSALWRKCNGKSDFRLSEVREILQLLGLSDPVPIFFDDGVSEMTRNTEPQTVSMSHREEQYEGYSLAEAIALACTRHDYGLGDFGGSFFADPGSCSGGTA